MATAFSDYMTAGFIRSLNPKRGDFFLTMSQTGANTTVRDWSGSKYGHTIMYLGETSPTEWRIGDLHFSFPSRQLNRMAFELPLKAAELEHILADDGCFGIAHVSCPSLSDAQRNKLFTLCAGFAFAKKDQGNRGGYSDRMAILYGLVDTIVNNTTGKVIGNDNFIADTQRLGSKMVNATVQTLVQMVDGYPNLNCSSLVAWLFDQIDKPLTNFSTTTSPGDLFQAAKSNRAFTVTELDFDSFARAPGSRGGASVRGPGQVPL